MNAFISYSLNDAEAYIVTILAMRLREQGYVPISGYDYVKTNNVEDSRWSISRSTLFIGIISSTGDANQQVFGEWKLAQECSVPAILLVEDNVKLAAGLSTHPNVVRFNREAPNTSIELVKHKIRESRQVPVRAAGKQDKSIAWVLGGVAITGLIGLFAAASR